MNISNDILFKAVSAFVDAISDGIAQSVDARMSDRIQKLEDRFDQLSTASDERIVEIIKSDEDIQNAINSHVESAVESALESALENYDPTDHTNFESGVQGVVEDAYWFTDAIKSEVRDLEFRCHVEVR